MTVARPLIPADHLAYVKGLAAAGDTLAIATIAGWRNAGALDPASDADRTEGPTDIRSTLPAAARLATAADSARVLNPKIWAIDVERWRGRKFAGDVWLSACRAAAHKRVTGDVLEPVIFAACEVLLRGSREKRDGKASMTFQNLARLVGCCKETARKIIRWLEDKGLVDTFNVLSRTAGKVLRDANLYLLTVPSGTPELPAAVEEPAAPAAPLGPLARMNARLERWASHFGLVSRAWGLNATPGRPRTGPEPPATPV